jgi:PIN domain nuclease of toxin-antitoxin system
MILIDTCILLRYADGTPIPDVIERALRQEAWAISALSAWEIAIKYSIGKLPLDVEPMAWWPKQIAHHRLTVVPYTDSDALRAGTLPPLHTDPFDRGIIATSIERHWALATVDGHFPPYAISGLRLVGR